MSQRQYCLPELIMLFNTGEFNRCTIVITWGFHVCGSHCQLQGVLRFSTLSPHPSPRSLCQPSSWPRSSRTNPWWRPHYEFRFFRPCIQSPACRLFSNLYFYFGNLLVYDRKIIEFLPMLFLQSRRQYFTANWVIKAFLASRFSRFWFGASTKGSFIKTLPNQTCTLLS